MGHVNRLPVYHESFNKVVWKHYYVDCYGAEMEK